MFQLKKGQEAFTPVEGVLAGRKFFPGQLYAEIPPETSGRFTEIKEAAAPETSGTDLKSVPQTTAKADSKKTVANPPSEKGEVK